MMWKREPTLSASHLHRPAPTLLILSNRFDRFADKAKPLPGQMVNDEESK